MNDSINNGHWPQFSYSEFKPTAHLIHMLLQAIGKLKLLSPFEPEWSNVSLWLTSRGITTGLINYDHKDFSVDVDLIDHRVICSNTKGETCDFNITATSVAKLTNTLFTCLKKIGIDAKVDSKPQEVSNPILFHEDTKQRDYNPDIIHTWWQILINTQHVMQHYHSHFTGKTPPIGLMWGTLDLRDVRFNGKPIKPTGINAGYIRRNAMDEEQIELGWWGGNELYPHAAYYSFTYPQPKNIERAKITPHKARWDNTLNEFLLDYDDLLQSKHVDKDLLAFFESTYKEGAMLSGWNPKLEGLGKPI